MADCRLCLNYNFCKRITKDKDNIIFCTGFNDIRIERYPKIWIKDKHTGKIFQYGHSQHDALFIDKGRLCYHNMANGCSSQFGGLKAKDCSYEFVVYDEENKCEMTPEEMHKRGLDKYISFYELFLNDVNRPKQTLEFESAEQRLRYYQAMKEECEEQIRLAQIEIDRGKE